MKYPLYKRGSKQHTDDIVILDEKESDLQILLDCISAHCLNNDKPLNGETPHNSTFP